MQLLSCEDRTDCCAKDEFFWSVVLLLLWWIPHSAGSALNDQILHCSSDGCVVQHLWLVEVACGHVNVVKQL